jgi:hypothetical protein
MNNNGQVWIRILIVLVSVSVIATALNMNITSGRKFYAEDAVSMLATNAKSVFNELGYHLKMAGFGQSDGRKAIEIKKGTLSDTLIVRYKDVETTFYVNSLENPKRGVLCKSIDGAPREIAGGVQRLRFGHLTSKMLETEITLDLGESDSQSGIVRRSFSTMLRIGYN